MVPKNSLRANCRIGAPELVEYRPREYNGMTVAPSILRSDDWCTGRIKGGDECRDGLDRDHGRIDRNHHQSANAWTIGFPETRLQRRELTASVSVGILDPPRGGIERLDRRPQLLIVGSPNDKWRVHPATRERAHKTRNKRAAARRDQQGFGPPHAGRSASGENNPGDHREILIPVLKVDRDWTAALPRPCREPA